MMRVWVDERPVERLGVRTDVEKSASGPVYVFIFLRSSCSVWRSGSGDHVDAVDELSQLEYGLGVSEKRIPVGTIHDPLVAFAG